MSKSLAVLTLESPDAAQPSADELFCVSKIMDARFVAHLIATRGYWPSASYKTKTTPESGVAAYLASSNRWQTVYPATLDIQT